MAQILQLPTRQSNLDRLYKQLDETQMQRVEREFSRLWKIAGAKPFDEMFGGDAV
jgi:hypothetical protein